MSWKTVYENEIASGAERFSYEWYCNHSITREISNSGEISGKLCDVACGLGIRSLIFANHGAEEIIGVDGDLWAIEFARNEAAKRNINAKFEVANFYNLPFDDASFNTVIFTAAIEHAVSPLSVIEELVRITRLGGKVIITVTENDYHADPDHKSSFNEKGLSSFLSCFGSVRTWVADRIIYAVLTVDMANQHSDIKKPKLVYADIRHPDTYTEFWDSAFKKYFDVTLVDFGYDGKISERELAKLISSCSSADVIHFGTGAMLFDNAILDLIREINPLAKISKWWGDVSPDRYLSECLDKSKYYDTIFMSVSNYVGQCDKSCTQIHMNSPGVPSSTEIFPYLQRPFDVSLFANAYSQARRERFEAYLPIEAHKTIWYGDGSPAGRLHRTFSNHLLGLSRITLNIVDPEHLGFRHWFSARVSNALAAGCIVISSDISGIDSALGNIVVVADDSSTSWTNKINEILASPDVWMSHVERVKDYHRKFLTYERAVATMGASWGLLRLNESEH